MSPRAKKISEAAPTYETAFSELQKIVTKLEGGTPPLEEALTLYERGQELAKICSDLLEKAELRIRELAPAKSEPDEPDEE